MEQYHESYQLLAWFCGPPFQYAPICRSQYLAVKVNYTMLCKTISAIRTIQARHALAFAKSSWQDFRILWGVSKKIPWLAKAECNFFLLRFLLPFWASRVVYQWFQHNCLSWALQWSESYWRTLCFFNSLTKRSPEGSTLEIWWASQYRLFLASGVRNGSPWPSKFASKRSKRFQGSASTFQVTVWPYFKWLSTVWFVLTALYTEKKNHPSKCAVKWLYSDAKMLGAVTWRHFWVLIASTSLFERLGRWWTVCWRSSAVPFDYMHVVFTQLSDYFQRVLSA